MAKTGKKLIIVESPAKIKTLKKFLQDQDFIFESSVGHIRDLPAKGFGIDLENNFEPTYETLPDKKEVIAKLKNAAKQCDIVYLSPDPDREGEAIAWHISEILPKGTKYQRISFNSITKEEVLRAIAHPREIDIPLVNAQQARRLLDRMVGYKISPILNRKLQRGRGQGVSAGRVQSVALILVVQREKEIELFVPVEYWNLTAELKTSTEERQFRAHLWSVEGVKVEKEAIEGKEVYLVNTQEKAQKLRHQLEKASYKVGRVERKEKQRHPVPPFITSTLQQEASRHLGFSASRTMSVAQTLYEGIDLGEGPEGLITYMRTDSVRTAPEAIEKARSVILDQYGKTYLSEQVRHYSTKKSAQDAHEAIRPANPALHPDAIHSFLTKDQFNLYQLIYRRFISSQMASAIYDTISADIETNTSLMLRTTGSVLKFPGFLAVYQEMEDEESKDEEERELPKLEEGQHLNLLKLNTEQAFTRPPPRYTEASLVKELEKSGIGRPSTYATIMNKIQSREYTVKENRRLKPTELGRIIAQMLEMSFEKIMNTHFTAQMEDDLELVAMDKKDWKDLLKEFWDGFLPTLTQAEKEAFVPKLLSNLDCPTCGSKLQKVWYKDKYFYGCSHYPECNFSAPIEQLEFNKADYAPDFNWDQPCPTCQSPMVVRHGRYGSFLGCSRYPDCRGIVKIPAKGEAYIPPEEMPDCPAIDCPGKIVARKSRFGKTFYSCSTYPACDVIVNNVDDLETKYAHHTRTPYEKKIKEKKGAKKEAPAKTTVKASAKKTATKKAPKKSSSVKRAPRKAEGEMSPELKALVGEENLPRTEITKKLWDYIKEHDLQNPKDKRQILPDEKLAALFGSKEPLNMMKLAGVISNNLK